MKVKKAEKSHATFSEREVVKNCIDFLKVRKRIIKKIKELSLHLNELRNENKELRDRIREIKQRNKQDRELMLRSEVFMV
jgi:hypothetical protein